MKFKEEKWKFLFFFLIVAIGIWMVKRQPEEKKSKIAILGPKEIQYFCLVSKNGSTYSNEVFGIDWRKGILSFRLLNNKFPNFNKDILKEYPILQGPFTFQNNNINFKTVDEKDEWVTPLAMDPESRISLELDWHGNKYSQAACPWQEDQLVKNIKNLFFKKKISILCLHNPKNSANSVFVLNEVQKIYWIWGTESLRDWTIFSQSSRTEGTYYNDGETISLELSEGKRNNFKISKKSQGQILELRSGKETLSQDSCIWISKTTELAEIKKNRNSYYCLKPFVVGLKKTEAKSTSTKMVARDYSVDEYPQVSSVIQLNETQKTFKFFGNFLGDIMELLEVPTNEGTISEAGDNLSFFSKEGKKIFTGIREEKGLEIKGNIFKNEYCQF